MPSTETKVRFSEDTKNVEEVSVMDPETASNLYEAGAFLLIQDLPVGTEIGIDMKSWDIGPKFLGIKMIPPGLHFVYYSPKNVRDGSLAPRRGFFHHFESKQVVVKKYDKVTEELISKVDEEEIKRVSDNLKHIDSNLGPYPFESWKKWVSLSSRINNASLKRLLPKMDPTISSSTEILESDGIKGLDDTSKDLGLCINFTIMSKTKHPPNCTPNELTKYNLDSSYQLGLFLDQHENIEEVLVELQFSFLCFLVGQNYESFCHWKRIVDMLCGCFESLLKYPQLFINFISDMHFQMQEVPEDFFVDIISSNNFLVTSLTNLFSNIKEQDDALKTLKSRAISFENHLTKKFGWSFNEDEDEDLAPVMIYEL